MNLFAVFTAAASPGAGGGGAGPPQELVIISQWPELGGVKLSLFEK